MVIVVPWASLAAKLPPNHLLTPSHQGDGEKLRRTGKRKLLQDKVRDMTYQVLSLMKQDSTWRN